MSQKSSVPRSLQAFMKDGIEAADCSICREPFDNTHIVIQIKECGHHFGKNCLEKWLQLNGPKGTCPHCRGVLFTSSPQTRVSQNVAPPPRAPGTPPSPTNFNVWYANIDNRRQSSRIGFLSKIWHLIVPERSSTITPVMPTKDHIIWVHNADSHLLTDQHNVAEREMLTPYMRKRSTDRHSCPLISLTKTLSQLFSFCAPTFVPSDGLWRAIFLLQARSNDTPPQLTWASLREAAWTLQKQRMDRQATSEQWRSLYLCLWLMSIYRSQRLGNVPSFNIADVRNLLRMLNFGYASAPGDAIDTKTRVFLSAAVYALELGKTEAGCDQDNRSRRLSSCHTSMAQLKTDVEVIWLEALAQGAGDVAAGYPEHWWTGL